MSMIFALSLFIISSFGNGLSSKINPAPFNFSLYSNCTYNPPPWDMTIYEDTTLLFSTVNSKNWGDQWTTVFWFADDIWTGTLKEYQLLLQYSFQNGTMDLQNKWGANLTVQYDEVIDLTVDDFYFNVTFFLGFCLIQDCSSQTYTTDEIKDFRDDQLITGDDEGVDYYIYSEVYAKESKKNYVHELMEKYAADFLAFSSYRMRCLTIQDNFEGWALYIEPLKVPAEFLVPEYITYGVYGFVGFCVLFAAIGAIHGFLIWGADCIRISGIIYFGLYTWDFYSDIVFALNMLNCPDDECPSTLFYAAIAFTVIPWIANMLALSRYQNKWCKDETIRERVYQWFVSWQRLTYALAALSGSAFGTVELANSYVFGMDFFCMGLNERHLKKFNNNRLYSSILVENAPQLAIQILYLYFRGIETAFEDAITIMAITTSTLSIGAALLDIYASKKLFSVLKKDGKYVGKTSCSLFVISPEIKENAKRLQVSTYAFREAIAETLSTHPRSVEMHFPIATSTGFKMKFTIFSGKLTPEIIHKNLKQGAESSKLPNRIKALWRLNQPVAMPPERIEVEKVESEDMEGAEGGEGNGVPMNNTSQQTENAIQMSMSSVTVKPAFDSPDNGSVVEQAEGS